MCTKICDCNNCFKNKTCTSCVLQSEVISKKEIDCQRDGIQGCPYKVKFPHKNKENRYFYQAGTKYSGDTNGNVGRAPASETGRGGPVHEFDEQDYPGRIGGTAVAGGVCG